MDHGQQSRSSLALARLLRAALDGDEGAVEAADAVKAAVERSMLFRFATGRRSPSADTIARLHDLSQGLIPANGWATAKRRKSAAARANSGHPDDVVKVPANRTARAGR
jgi:hypothetical protein